MSDEVSRVLLRGLRRSIHQPLRSAVAAMPGFSLADTPGKADVVVLDACGYEWDEPFRELLADARGAALPRIVLSVPGAGDGQEGSFVAEIAEREAAAGSGEARTCALRCSAFGQELAWSAPYETAGALYTAWQPEGAPWVDVADVAGLIALVASADRHWGTAYDVAGPEVLSMEKVCELLADLHDRPVQYVHLTADAHRSAMEQVGFDARHARQRSDYMEWTTSEPCRRLSPVLADALGRPPRRLDDYLVGAARSALALA